MALDPKFRELLDFMTSNPLPAPGSVDAPTMRKAMQGGFPSPEVALHSVKDQTIKGPGGALLVRIYTPTDARNLPALVYFHGGGFVLGNVDMFTWPCSVLARAAGCVVVSVEYRLAPETRFPGPLEDCYAATAWVAANAPQLGIDASRIAIGGDSAGGNLAISVALLARARGGPGLCHQALIYPVTDASFGNRSWQELGKDYFLTRETMQWFWDCYLTTPEQTDDPLVSPLRATDLAGLPPATVVTAEFDPLRDEGEAFADRLRAAGVPVASQRFLGVIHGFAGMPSVTPLAEQALLAVASHLKSAFNPAKV